MMLINIFKFVCLALAIAYTFSNVVQVLNRQAIDHVQIFIMGAAWAGFIELQWLI